MAVPIHARSAVWGHVDGGACAEFEDQMTAAPATSSSALPEAPRQATTQQQPEPTPRGTATAPELRPDGVPSSSAAGAAIAPVKQKRIRRIAFATALIVGAAVAIGVVVGTSAATPARQ